MPDPTDEPVGFFIVPAAHLDELHALKAAASEAEQRYDDPQRLEWWGYHSNQAFERAKAVATASMVIEDSKYDDAFYSVCSWLRFHVLDRADRYVLNPDELAAMARDLPDIRVEDVIRWMRKHRRIRRETEPLATELFEALCRTVAAAPAAPSGFAMLSFDEDYRHPPAPLPPAPEPEPDPPDLDEGALLGWFLVPAKHLPALQDIAAVRDAAFRQERWADFYALETRLFEQARAVAKTSDVFNAWAYRAANRAWWSWLPTEAKPMPPTILGPVQRDTLAYWLTRFKKLKDVPPGVCEDLDDPSQADLARTARELLQVVRRVADGRRARNCGLVIAWWFEKPPTWPRYDDASRRAAWFRVAELADQVHEAEAKLRAIEAKRKRAQAQAPDQTPAPTPRTAAGRGAKARGQRAPSSAARAALAQARDELAQRFPWLCRLDNHEDILASFARQIAWARMAGRTGQDADNPTAAAGTLPARMPIALAPLLTEDFLGGDSSVARAGRQAMAEAIARHAAWVELVLPRRGKPDVRVYLGDQRLRLQDGRLPATAFFARGGGRGRGTGGGGGALLDVRAAWYQAVAEEGRCVNTALYEAYPGLVVQRLWEQMHKLTAEGGWKRMDREVRARLKEGG